MPVSPCGGKASPRAAGRWLAPTLAILTVILVAGCGRGPKSCQVCQRAECKGIAFRTTLRNGQRVETCCPRCALHYLSSTKQQATTLQATDLSNGQWLDAAMAVYVSGSDVSPCASMEIRRDAYGCCALKDYDRCLPSVIAFGDRAAAARFQRQHGGELITFEQLVVKQPQPKTQSEEVP